jgi:hypothetical protein
MVLTTNNLLPVTYLFVLKNYIVKMAMKFDIKKAIKMILHFIYMH